MRDWTLPPSPEWVSTNEAAKLFGAPLTTFRNLMRRYHIPPIREYDMGGRVDKYWHPGLILQAKAIHSLRQRESQPKPTVDREALRLKAQAKRLENERQRVLARLKERQCATST